MNFLRHLRIQSAPVCVNYFSDLFLSRWFTPIYFSLITLIFCVHLRFQSAPVCVNYFSEFSPRHSNIPRNNSPLKIRGVPPKAGRCYDVGNEELEKWGLRMRSSALFNLRLSTWTYLFFSRRSTLIFFSLIHADLFSAPICEYLRELFFSEFSHPRPNIPQNYSLLKIRGVPPKAGRCYELIDNWQIIMDNIGEVKKSGVEEFITPVLPGGTLAAQIGAPMRRWGRESTGEWLMRKEMREGTGYP